MFKRLDPPDSPDFNPIELWFATLKGFAPVRASTHRRRVLDGRGRVLGLILGHRTTTQNPKTGLDLWAPPMVAERKPFSDSADAFEETERQFSPDRRRVAYQSNASGQVEVYVRPFPRPRRTLEIEELLW